MTDPSMQGELPGGGAPISSAGKRIGASLLDVLLAVITLGIGWFIWSLVVWGKGQSPAKQLMKMRSVNKKTGQCAGWGTMFVREIVGKGIIGSITFGIVSILSFVFLFSATRETVWDRISSTVVVDDPTGSLAP